MYIELSYSGSKDPTRRGTSTTGPSRLSYTQFLCPLYNKIVVFSLFLFLTKTKRVDGRPPFPCCLSFLQIVSKNDTSTTTTKNSPRIWFQTWHVHTKTFSSCLITQSINIKWRVAVDKNSIIVVRDDRVSYEHIIVLC